jgi:putative transposase
MTLDHAKEVIEAWRVDYNTQRPHGSLGHLTPTEFVARHGKSPACHAVKI